MTLTLRNAELAERIKALAPLAAATPPPPPPASDTHAQAHAQAQDSTSAIRQQLAALLAAVLAAPPAAASLSSAPTSLPQCVGDDADDFDDYGLPTLLPLYLSRLLESIPQQARSADLMPLAANLLRDHLGDSSLPLAKRLRGAIVFISLFRASPAIALDIFLLHAQDAFMESIADTLEPAADAPTACWSKPLVAQLVVALLDLLALAASHAAARPFITPLVPYFRILARSSSSSASAKSLPWASRGATFATNILTKLANGDHAAGRGVGGDTDRIARSKTEQQHPTWDATKASGDETKGSNASPESSIHYLLSTLTAETTPARERESLMESIALMSIQTDYRPLFMSSPLLGPLITMFRNPAILSALSPSLAFGFATLIHHLTMYPPRLTPEQRQLRRLAQFAQSGGRGAPPPKSTDENDEEARKQEDAITDRCLVLVKEHKVMVSLVGVYRSQSRLAQGSLSTSLSSTLGSIACHLAQTESLRGLLVQQGLVGMLVRIAPSDRAAAQALARCGITLNPAIAFGEQHVTSVANSLWTLVVPPPVTGGLLESKNQQQPMHDSSLAHYESLLAITNLATLPTLGPHLGDWFIRLDRSDSLLADNLDIRRAAWELLCNMVWTSPDVLEKCVDNPRRLRLVLDMAVAHSHHDEEPAMRRAVLGVLAALTCCAPVVQYLAEHVSERSSEEGQKQEDVVAVTHLERIMAVSKREKDVEMMHRLSQMWVHVVEDEQVGRAWGRKMGLSKVLDGFVKQAKGHGGVVGLVGEAMKSL